MKVRKLRRTLAWSLMFLFTLIAVGCTGEVKITPKSGSSSYPVDPIFKEFYQTLGGKRLLGPAITKLEIREELNCQFFENALLCLNPAVTDASRFFLYPLGRELKIEEDTPAVSAPVQAGGRVVDGIVIYEEFVPLYDQLYGARYVGRPLTRLRINQDLHRAEQFFENVGFYQNLNDPNGPVFLIPYGAYLCGGTCAYHLNEYWSIVKSGVVEQPFSAQITRLGGPAVFGSPLLKSEVAPDGYLHQVYTNVVFYAPPDDLGQMRLRPLPGVLGYEKQPLVAPMGHEQLVFYEVENGLGHNVPLPFDAFVTLHGGRELAGDPISEVILLENENLYRQCFENYCLIYDPTASDALRVRMMPLGEQYLKRYPPPDEAKIRDLFSPSSIDLIVSVDKSTLNANEEQMVRILVQEMDGEAPLERVEGSLVIEIPGQPAMRFFLTPTNAQGMSELAIPAQPSLGNGTRVSYQVCLNLPSERPICRSDSYLIWNVQAAP
jgi:hypothetical protein